VTVVIATRDRPERLARTLDELTRAAPGVAVLVCDDASRGDATARVVQRHPGVRHVRLHAGAGAAARNVGVREARTPLVAFCDDDSWWAPGALERAAAHFAADDGLGLLAGRVLVGDEERLDPVSALMARSPLGRRAAGPEILGFLACAAVVRRTAFLQAGGFPRGLGVGGEEAPLAIALERAGWRSVYAAGVVAHHHPDRARDPRARDARVARNDLWTVWSRRSAATALGRTAALAARATRDPAARSLLRAALPGLPRALRDRRAPGRALEDRLRDLEGQRAAGGRALPDDPPHDVLPARAAPPPGAGGPAAVTVVIAARNAWHQLERTLAEHAALPGRPPVVLVDDASTDGTVEQVRRRFPEVEVVRLHERCGPVARNVGVRRARTPYVAFSDADSWWAPGSLGRVAALLDAHPELGLLGAHILVGPEDRDDPICGEMARSPLTWHASPPGHPGLPGHVLASFMGGASAVRRAAFEDVGGFEPRLVVGGEEELLGAELVTAGWAMRYVPELVVHHHPEGTRRGEVRALGLRNTLWFAWRRRPWRAGLAWSAYVVRASGPRPETVRGLALALGGLGWVLRTRRRVPPGIERGLRQLQDQRRASRVVSYRPDRPRLPTGSRAGGGDPRPSRSHRRSRPPRTGG
jgi:GT2 family glycosyltransferase